MISRRKRIRVLCVDDHAMMAEGLKARLALEPDIEFAGWVSTAEHLADAAGLHRADVVLLDVDLPGADVFSELDELTRRFPMIRTIVFSAHVRDHYLDEAVNRGAWGYIAKSDPPQSLIDAIRKVSRGEVAFGPRVFERCRPADRPASRDDVRPASRLDLLTPREIEVLRMIGKGMSRTEIAQATHRSPKTIDNHRAAIMEKLQIHDRVELARFAIREGLTEA
ncbi:MAG: response regulator transcription factor [Phycisphaeraceae bacterium]|nr:response regulator transcription factor [Phycisphaerales bacterium]QOJ19002.1 MAG: response regulator transcription factor [Phycisphaeraceae bacterium]